MASFLATPTCPLVTMPTNTTRAAFATIQRKSFSLYGGPLFFEKIQFSKASSISSARSRCFKTTISCSAQSKTLEAVRITIAKQLSVDVSTVTPETKVVDLGADALDMVEIMMSLEEQFGVSIGESGAAENIVTVQDVADLIDKLKAETSM